MPTLFKAMLTNALIILLAATGGYVGGTGGAVACVIASALGSTVIFKVAVDAHGEGYQDEQDAEDEQ